MSVVSCDQSSHWVNMWQDEDKLLAHARLELTQTCAEQYALKTLELHVCVNCKETFRPATSVGKRECRVHPEFALDGTDASGFEKVIRGTVSGTRVRPFHYMCCGESDTFVGKCATVGLKVIHIKGCCHADHVSHSQWRNLIHIPSTRVMTARVLDTDDMPSSERSQNAALACRLQIFPRNYVLMLHRLRRLGDKEYNNYKRIDADNLSDDEVIRSIMGPDCIVIIDQKRLVSDQRFVVVRSGTLDIKVNLRDAYLAMCFDFQIPRETIATENYTEDGTETQPRTLLFREGDDTEKQLRREKLYSGDDDDAMVMEDSTAHADDGREIKLINMDNPMDFVPFVISSWIDPYVPPGPTRPFDMW